MPPSCIAKMHETNQATKLKHKFRESEFMWVAMLQIYEIYQQKYFDSFIVGPFGHFRTFGLPF